MSRTIAGTILALAAVLLSATGCGDKDEKDQGQITYTDCMEHDARVDGLETPRQFIRGSWHALADDLTIGWHPDYKAALAALESTADPTTEGS